MTSSRTISSKWWTRGAVGAVAGAVVLSTLATTAEARPRRISPALMRAPLIVTSFVQHGRTDVRRNEKLVFKFSAYVSPGSLDARSLRVLEQTGAGAKQAIGALIPRANFVIFDPSRTQRNYDDSLLPDSGITDIDNPTGFGSYTDFSIRIPGPPELHVLRNGRGQSIRKEYVASFRTAARYDDAVPGAPYFIGVGNTGRLAFDPPSSPTTGLVDEDALILLEFNEPIDIDTLDPSQSFLVTRRLISGASESVPGIIRIAPNDRSGRKFQFVPSLGFGGQGWQIDVELTTDITDLAGNALKRGQKFFTAQQPAFTTRPVPGKPTASIISETFANQLKMDPVTVTDGGEWNTTEKGALRGGPATSYPNVNVNYRVAGPSGIAVVLTRQNDPLVTDKSQGSSCLVRPNGSHTQFLYIPSDVGAAAAVVLAGWGPSSNATFGSSHPEISLKMGHTGAPALGTNMDANVDLGMSQVYKGSYTIAQQKNVQPADGTDAQGVTRDPVAKGYALWPAFQSPFEWNGTNNLVFDAACQPGITCQIQRGSFIPAGVPFPFRRAVGLDYTTTTANFANDTIVMDMQFRKRRRTTTATSTWYQLGSDSAQFDTPIVNPAAQPGGVSVAVELEGADGKVDPITGLYVPNTSTQTGWKVKASDINGRRFFRFRVTMVANLTTSQTARVTSLQFPYIF